MQSNQWEHDGAGPEGGEGQAGGVTPQADEPAQMPLGLSDEELGGELDGALDGGFSAPRSAASGRVLMLAIVLAVGGGTLWAMRMSGGSIANGVSTSADEARIDQALEQLQGGGAGEGEASPAEAIDDLFKDTDNVITLFGEDPTANQVDLDNLQKNPFDLFLAEGDGDEGGAGRAIDRVKNERLARIRSELDRMSLQSLLSGASSLAVISGEVVREGDTIGSFTVTGISPYGVRLSAEGNTYTLTMDEKK